MTSTTAPTGSGARLAAAWRSFRTSVFWGACRRQIGWLIAGVLVAIVTTLLTTLVANAAAALVDRGIIERTDPLGPLATRLIVLSILGFIVGVVGKLIAARIGYTLDLDLRNLLYLRLHRSRPAALNRFSTGQIVTRSLADLQALRYFISTIQLVVTFIPVLIGLTIWIFLQSPILALLAASGLIVNAFLVNKIRHRLWGLSYLQLDQLSRITTAIDEPVRGIRVVKWFGRERDEREKVAKASAANYRYTLTRERFRARYDVIFRFAPTAVRFLVLIVGARLVVGGSITLGQFNVLFTFVTVGSYLADSLDLLVSLYQLMKTGAGRLNEVLMGGPRLEPRSFEPLPEPGDGLEIRRATVDFGGHTITFDVDVTVAPGEVTVVTGPPGSGKSTLAGLAAGSLAATSGAVLLDGVDIQRIDPQELRTAVHVVTEEPFLFGRTLRDNLLMGVSARHDPAVRASDDQLFAAIDAAGASDVVATLDRGLDTVIGDRGLTLSGGQRQRLAVARALVEQPRVLVLDDALSAVSPSLEIDIIRRLQAHAPSMGILCVGRRESLASIADRTVALPTPEVSGTPAVLTIDEESLGDAKAAVVADMPYDPRLVDIVQRLQLDRDQPSITMEEGERDERIGLLSAMRPVRTLVALLSILVIVYELISLIPTYLIGDAADVVQEGREAKDAGNAALAAEKVSSADKLALATLGLAIVLAGIYYMRRIVLAKSANNVVHLIRLRIISRLTRLGIGHFDREMPGAISTRVVHDIDTIKRFADDIVPDLLQVVLRVAVTLGIVTFLVPEVGPIAIGFAALVFIVTLVQVPLANALFTKQRLALGDVVTRFQEDFAGRHIIQSFGGERRARMEFGELNRKHRDAQRNVEVLRAFFSEGLEVLRDVCVALVYLRSGNLVLAGAITAGTVITLRLYLEEALRPIPRLGTYWQRYQETRVSIQQVNTLWDVAPTPVERAGAKVVQELEGALTFENVSFRYPGTSRQVVSNLSFDVAPGDRIAIVGHTGAGKSSIAKLLGRIYDPDEGRVLVDGIDLRDLDLTSYRRRIGVVPQEAFLFRGTVASNIGYARPGATREDIEAAARRAGAYETLAALEGDFDARVEEEGRNLTAAERQLIALSRAVLADPDILVLDEATSNLDGPTEAKVIDALLALGLTTVLVTHRLPLAERADLVVMLDSGRITEAGSHAELVAGSGEYPKLWVHSLATASANGRRRRTARAKAGVGAKKASKSAKTTRKAGTNGSRQQDDDLEVTVEAKSPRANGAAKKVTVSAKKSARRAAAGSRREG